MDELLTIQIELMGGQAVVDQLNQVSAAIRSMNPYAAQIKSLSSASNQAAQAQSAFVRQVSQSANATKNAIGPAQRLLKAQQDLIRANQSGSPMMIMDAKYNLGRAQARFNKAFNPQPPDFMTSLRTFIRSTRFGAGGVSPLIGRGMDLLTSGTGMSPKVAGALSVAAVGAGVAITALTKAAKFAADGLMDFSNLRYSTGSTYGQASQLKGIGMALGLDMGGLSRTLATADYTAQSRLGISNPMGGTYYGNLNEGADLLRAIEALRKMSEPDAIRSARAAGLEGVLPLRDLNEGEWQQLKKSMEDMKPSAQDTSAAMKYNVEMAKMTTELQKLATSTLPLVTAGIRLLNGGVINDYLINPLSNTKLGKYGGGANPFGTRFDHAPKVNEPHTVALNENSKALKELAIKMDGMRRDLFGGGERAKGALPAGQRGEMMRQSLRADGLKLGAFNL